jgi:hypothetical protein
MKKILTVAILAALSGTAVAGGIDNVSGSTAISGSQSASGSYANTGAATAGNTQNVNIEAPSSNIRYSGSHTVRSAPDTTLIVPGMTAPCVISVGASGSGVGFGFGIAAGLEDKDCTAREDARTLLSIGLKDEAIARLCLRADMKTALGPKCPQPVAPATLPAGPQVSYNPSTRQTTVTVKQLNGFNH